MSSTVEIHTTEEAVQNSPPQNPLQTNECNLQQIQIRADVCEIKRRINAFITRKRMEVDEINLHEFCNRPNTGEGLDKSGISCARVDAVLVKRSGSKSHVKISRVVNSWGPQTQTQVVDYCSQPEMIQNISELNQIPPRRYDSTTHPSSIEERLCNMETHLKLKSGQSVSKDVYERLRNLENRILFLEGMSPDYFGSSPNKMQKLDSSQRQSQLKRGQDDMSISEIDLKIQRLREALQNKQSTIKNVT